MKKHIENQNQYGKNKREKKAQAKKDNEESKSDDDEDEDQKMLKANPARIQVQEKILKRFKNIRYNRALEVACSRAHLTNDLLKNKYKKIDLFDKDRVKVNELKRKFILNSKDIQPTAATMENFEWKYKYDGIFLHWCLNYLTREKGI